MAVITFYGPRPDRYIVAVNSSGQEVARFIAEGSKSHFTISRATVPGAPPVNICAASSSVWSDDYKLNVHGTEMKLKWDNPFGQEAHMKTYGPMGTLQWSEDGWTSMSKYKLVDGSKTVVGRGSTKERKFEVLVPGNEQTFDLLLSCWIGYLVGQKTLNILSSGGGSGGGGFNNPQEAVSAAKIIHAYAGAADAAADAGGDAGS